MMPEANPRDQLGLSYGLIVTALACCCRCCCCRPSLHQCIHRERKKAGTMRNWCRGRVPPRDLSDGRSLATKFSLKSNRVNLLLAHVQASHIARPVARTTGQPLPDFVDSRLRRAYSVRLASTTLILSRHIIARGWCCFGVHVLSLS